MKLPNKAFKITFIIFLMVISDLALAQETEIMVRVKAKDAKFIGSSMGGAEVVIRDSRTGKLLAEGKTTGSTGSTDKIMQNPTLRHARITNENTAGYLAKLNISEPVLVTVEAFAPGNTGVKSSTQLWILPGKDITGEGLILEIPGFIVDVINPQAHEKLEKDNTIKIVANIIMMCGCPVTAGGIWDADSYDINAVISRENTAKHSIPMKASDKPSTFQADVTLSPGNYEVAVYVYDPVTGNTGLGKTNFIVN